MRKTTIALYIWGSFYLEYFLIVKNKHMTLLIVVGIALTHSFATKPGFLHQSNFPLNLIALSSNGIGDSSNMDTNKNIIGIITELEGRTGLGKVLDVSEQCDTEIDLLI